MLRKQTNTVSVRNPDVRISAFLKHVRLPNMSGFRTFGWLTLQPPVIGRPDFRPKPVPNQFGTGFGHLNDYDSDVRNPDTGSGMDRTSENRI